MPGGTEAEPRPTGQDLGRDTGGGARDGARGVRDGGAGEWGLK